MLLQGERKGHWNDIEFMGKTVSLLTKGAVGMNRRITVKYCFLQGGYWTLAAVAMAFTTPLLEAKGFSGTEIGILSAVKYLAVLIFQMVLGSFADKHAEKVPLPAHVDSHDFCKYYFFFFILFNRTYDVDGNAHANCFWYDNPLRFAACGFAVHPVHEPRRENELRHIACLRFFVLGRFLRCGRFDCRCVWGKPHFVFQIIVSFYLHFLRLIWMLSIFQREEKRKKKREI